MKSLLSNIWHFPRDFLTGCAMISFTLGGDGRSLEELMMAIREHREGVRDAESAGD